jgi:nitrogen fixation NifU-like protein
MTLPYGVTVLEHFRHPRNQRRLVRPTASRERFNPLCGDRVRIELEIIDGTIREAAFSANACAICTASASLLTERVCGLSVEAAARITNDEVLTALDAELPEGRLECAILPARTMRDALSEVPASA